MACIFTHLYNYHQKCGTEGCDSGKQNTLYRALRFECRDMEHPPLCYRCAFLSKQCLIHRQPRADDYEDYKETDPDMIAWSSN